MTAIHPYDQEVIDRFNACLSERPPGGFVQMVASSITRQDLKLAIEALQRPRLSPDEDRRVNYATVRDAEVEDECGVRYKVLHIETRFSNGEKYAAVTVDAQEEALALQIAGLIAGRPAPKNPVDD